MESSCCEFLAWDTEFFGARIARLKTSRPSPSDIEAALDWCRRERIACLYFLAESGDLQTVRLAEENGFRMTDQRITFARKLTAPTEAPPADSIRPSLASDIPSLTAIARQSHRDTRFYFDPRFAQSRCDDLYAVWIEKSCTGWAQRVLVAAIDGEAAGYCSCHLTPDGVGSIGLIAVAPQWQARGFGPKLVSSALAFFQSNQATRVTVVTQGRNVAAQRLYQRAGFVTDAVQIWYHKWFE
jgi:dTDP-4-amino-4,6-dideoxy-D-galactose acyltransferase